MLDLKKPWTEFEFIAFDTETSGAYPFGSEVVEFGAVKWRDGKEIGTYQTLLKPSQPMSDFIIGIHGITNEMVDSAPLMSEKIQEIRDFLGESILMAHHAPFDLGFLALDFERNKVPFPKNPALCTSLLARKVIFETANHKLQTLIGVLGLEQGAAHRALDDARACLYVGIESMKRIGPQASLEKIFSVQEKILAWERYALLNEAQEIIKKVVETLQKNLSMDIIYDGGSGKGATRRITPIGIVRNPDGDYVMAKCHRDQSQKRFYLHRIKDSTIVYS